MDEAIQYALSKDVVLVHAAGNDATDNDTDDNYPSSHTIEGTPLPNIIQVGASGDASVGGIVAAFSNYGKKQSMFLPPAWILTALLPATEHNWPAAPASQALWWRVLQPCCALIFRH